MKENLKLYVWEKVLTCWTDGIMFALAPNKAKARELILKKYGSEWSDEDIRKDLKKSPRCISKPEGFFVCGGA